MLTQIYVVIYFKQKGRLTDWADRRCMETLDAVAVKGFYAVNEQCGFHNRITETKS